MEQESWMSPLNKIIWHNAVRQRKAEVTLPDGRKFKLTYDCKYCKPHGDWAPKGYVMVKPIEGLVPMGYLNIETVQNKAKWLGEF
jgi:hypothetical protein